MVPAVRLEQPQVRLPADSKSAPQAMQRRTLIVMGERAARRRATFFCSMSFTTLGGKILTFAPLSTLPKPLRLELTRLGVGGVSSTVVELDPDEDDSELQLRNARGIIKQAPFKTTTATPIRRDNALL